ncbi:MAG: hypothetical protein RLY86_2758 [Pseudomonadota bacterium]|jgi:hypothetical protein
MTQTPPIMTLASRLVGALGERAIAHCRMRRVEMIAADHRYGARFWLSVMTACEQELARHPGERASAGPVPDQAWDGPPWGDRQRGDYQRDAFQLDAAPADQRATAVSAPG